MLSGARRVAMTLVLMLLTTATAWAQGSHDYIDENGNPNSHGAVVLTSSNSMATIGTEGEMTWYVVTGNINYDDMLTIKGDVHLILYDGKTMTVDGVYNYHNGISLEGTLTIYGQTNGTGTLNVNGYYYGIYTEDKGCDLTICGGTVNVNGYYGIYAESCNLTISGGTVTATGTATGTGTGIYTESCNLTIKGGTVNATGTGTDGIGIDVSGHGSVTFSGSIDHGIQFGATVTATGGKFGIAASGESGITLSGGTVTANSGYSGDVTIDLPGGYGYIDDENQIYASGTLTDMQKSAINMKTLHVTAVIAYIDGNGRTRYRDASKVERFYDDTYLHGDCWYVIHGTVNLDHSITFSGGAVCIILEDGATLNIGADDKKIDGPGINCGSSGIGIDNLFIYGQSGGTGTLNVYTTGAENHAIHAEYITICGVHVNATTDVGYAIYADGDVAITGGTVNATSIAANGTITLGWTRTTDRITASSYTSGNDAVSIDGFLTDGTTVYSGIVTALTTLAGKTLQPYGYSLTANEADGNRWTTFYSSQTGFHIETANAYAYTAEYDNTDPNDPQLTLTKLGTDIPAGTAVIIASATSPVMLAIDGTVGNYSGPTNNLHGVDVQTMKSSLYPSSDKSGTFYVMSKKGSDFGFFQYTADYMPARKAYLLVSGSGAPLAPGLKMMFGDGETNSLSPIPSPSREGGASAWYTLDGRRLQGKPTQKGLYIHGNIKVVIK